MWNVRSSGRRDGGSLARQLVPVWTLSSSCSEYTRESVLFLAVISLFRPNAEFAFGELTDMVALNLEGAYRLPISFRHGRWSAYVGAGPGTKLYSPGNRAEGH